MSYENWAVIHYNSTSGEMEITQDCYLLQYFEHIYSNSTKDAHNWMQLLPRNFKPARCSVLGFDLGFCLIKNVYLKQILCLPHTGRETKDFIAACIFQNSWTCDGLSCRFSSQETRRTGMESTAAYIKEAPMRLMRN